MERFSDEAQRNNDKQLEVEHTRLHNQNLFQRYIIRCLLLVVGIFVGGVTLVMLDSHDDAVLADQFQALNRLRLETEARLNRCVDARIALEISCDVLAKAANGCTCVDDSLTEPYVTTGVLSHLHPRKVRR